MDSAQYYCIMAGIPNFYNDPPLCICYQELNLFGSSTRVDRGVMGISSSTRAGELDGGLVGTKWAEDRSWKELCDEPS